MFDDYVAAFEARWLALEDARTRRLYNDVNDVGRLFRVICSAHLAVGRRR